MACFLPTSNLYQSWLPPPKGPSIRTLGGLSLSSSWSLIVLSKLKKEKENILPEIDFVQ